MSELPTGVDALPVSGEPALSAPRPQLPVEPPTPALVVLPLGFARYSAIWGIPGAPRLIIGGVIARLPVGMVGLALILAVHSSYSSYALAGLATALMGLAYAVTAPPLGRLLDRIGPRRVLPALALLYAAALLGAWGVSAVHGPILLLFLLCALTGAASPPQTPVLRALWSDVTEGPLAPLRTSVLTLETTAFESVFVLAPLLVGLFATLSSPGASLGAAALFSLVGTAMVARGGIAKRWRPHPERGASGGFHPLRTPGFPALMGITLGLTCGFGAIMVAVPAFVGEHTAESAPRGAISGALLALSSVASILGGLWFGARDFRAGLPDLWAVTLAAVALGNASLMLAPNIAWFAALFFLGGFPIASCLAVENTLVARAAPPGTITEAYTWMSTVIFAGLSAGGAVAGYLAEHAGATLALLSAALPGACAALAAWSPRSALRRLEHPVR